MDDFQVQDWQYEKSIEKKDVSNICASEEDVEANIGKKDEQTLGNLTNSPAVSYDGCMEAKDNIGTDDTCAETCDASKNDDRIIATIAKLSEKIDQMNELFVRKIQHTTHEEKIVDQMHAELQKYKDDMYAQLLRPILLDIIEVRDSIRRVSDSYASKPDSGKMMPIKTFSDYTYDIQDILEKNNIVIFDSKEGDVFNALKQRIIKKVTTPVEELHGKIAESFSSGYEYMGKLISPEKVAVYIYQKNKSTEGEN